jgi:phosphatidylinositol 4-kinase
MQSAAKVPILVAFEVDIGSGSGGGHGSGGEDGGEHTAAAAPISRLTSQACIFKVGDDCRQDVLALQVIRLLADALAKAGLDLFLAPYGVIPTAYECGIIEVVPDCRSRSALGETCDGGLFDIFRREFGAPGSARFEAARSNFIASAAGYAVACYLLQAKDRHNGNILITRDGHLVHIDFGFILGISPGGNLGFESAAFKLSHEMTQLLDPGGKRTSPQFRGFVAACVRGFLAARGAAAPIIAAITLMADSGLPCYGYGAPVAKLTDRFHLELTDAQAASFFRGATLDAYDKWTTGLYDGIQWLQQSIPK